MADEIVYTPQKVRLMTPEGASEHLYLYPVTGLNAITAGTTTAGDAYTTPIAVNGKIQAQYLDIMTQTPTAVAASTPQYLIDNNRLSFIISGSTINESYIKVILDPLTTSARINPDYLPGYVDDVVDVPIKRTDSYPATGDLLISAHTIVDEGTTYWFYKKSTTVPGQWDLGGGESGKLYVGEGETDGAIYRAVNTSSAAKISESPYSIDTTDTNGVHLTKISNNLAAVARLATTSSPGTIQIDSAALSSSPVKNVWFGLTNGILSISESLADGTNAGIVFAAGTQVQYDALIDAGRNAVSIVPTVDWMQSSIDSAIVGVSSATYDNLGIVQIQEGGNIIVSSGLISVPNAAYDVAGVVELVDTINTATTGNASKAVTQGGITQYVGQQLLGYQQALTKGNGIDIDNSNVISIRKTGDALGFTGGQLIVSSATATTMGAVLITGDYTFITGGTTAVDEKPVAVNAVAVKNYVDYRLNHFTPPLPVAGSNTSGAVVIRSLEDATNNDDIYFVPPAKNVKAAIAGATASVINAIYTSMFVAGNGIDFGTNGTLTVPQITIKADIDSSETALYLKGSTDNQKKLAIHTATASQLGVVQVGTGLDITIAGVLSVPEITTKEEFAVAANSGKFATVGAIVSYVASQIEGQRPITSGTGITITSQALADEISVNYTGAIVADGEAITVRTATTSLPGVVKIADTKERLASDTYAEHVPTASAVSSYIDNQLLGYQTTMSQGAAIEISDATVSVDYGAPLTLDGNGKLTVSATGPLSVDQVTSSLVIGNASTDSRGVIRLGNGFTSRTGGDGIVDVAIATSANYVDAKNGNTSGGVAVSLGGARVVKGSGIGVESGNLYLNIAGSTLGGVMKAPSNTGIDITAEGVVSANIDTNVMSFTNANEISVKPATITSGGIVKVLADDSLVGADDYDGHVPTVKCLEDYVADQIAGGTVTVVGVSGVTVTSSVTGKATTYSAAAVAVAPLSATANGLTINTASANITGTVGPSEPTTLGAVYVVGTTVRKDFTGVNYTANTVPTESAVRAALNAIPYITWEPLNN